MMAKSSFLRHAAVYGAGDLLVYGAGFLLLPVYVRCLSEEQYGTLEVLNRLGEVVLLCLLVKGLRQALLTFHNQAETERERRAVAGSALFVTVLFLGAGGGLAALAAEPLCRQLDLGDPGVLRLAVIAVFTEALTLLLLALAQARLESVFFALVSIGQFLVRVTLCIVLVTALGWGIRGVVLASAISSGVFALWLLGRELVQHGLHLDVPQVKAMCWFALPFVPGGLGFFLLNSGDRFFLLGVNRADLGAYALGYKLALLVKLFSRDPLYRVWSTRMYEAARQPDAAGVFGKVFTRVLMVYTGVGLGLCLMAEECVGLLGGGHYLRAAGIIAPVVLAYLFQTATDLMDAGFYIKRKTAWKLPITLAATAVMLLLYALLIPRCDIAGAAWATLLGFAFMAVLTLVVSQRAFAVDYEWGRVCGMLLWAALVWLLGRVLPMLTAKAGLWLGWLTLLWWTVFSEEEKRWVRGLFAACGLAGRAGKPQAARRAA